MSAAGGSFSVSIKSATDEERRSIERTSSAPLASDACVLVRLNDRLIGWGDDYGTFHPPTGPTSLGRLEEAGERLLQAAVELWEVENR